MKLTALQLRLIIYAAAAVIVFGGHLSVALFVGAVVWSGIMSVWKRYYKYLPIFLGGLSNAIAIFSNGGQMPVRGASFALTGSHKAMTAATHFKALCDVIPAGHYAILSVGDISITLIFFLTILGIYVYNRFKSRGLNETRKDI